jgi:hypothetical protein
MLEFYLDDFLIQCYTMEKPPDGIVFYQNTNDLRLWQWKIDAAIASHQNGCWVSL